MNILKIEETSPLSSQNPTQTFLITGEHTIVLPKQLEGISPATAFPQFRHRWNTNEEIASLLISFTKHKEWLQTEVKPRPSSGSMLLYSRSKARYRKDGYCWKKRKDGKNIREDHMKLKVQGLECIYGSYVHSDILPTFHRRCYWLLQNPDIVLVHYLNVPYPDNTKVKIPMMPTCTLEKKEWTKEDLVDQLKPMFSTGRTDEESEQMIDETVEALVRHLIEYHENSKRIERDKSNQKKLQESFLHSTLQLPSEGDSHITKEAAYLPQHDSASVSSTTIPSLKKCAKHADGNSRVIVHHKATDLDLQNNIHQHGVSSGMTPGPYILSLDSNLAVSSSNYLVVNGLANPVSTPVLLNDVCHTSAVVPPNVVISQKSGNHTSVSPHFSHSGSVVMETKLKLNSDKMTASVPNKNTTCTMHDNYSSQLRVVEPLIELRDDKQNLVPYLKTVTAEDVQNMIQSHEKDKDDVVLPEIDSEQFSASLGSSDFDNLDLELPDFDKLCSFLGSPLDASTNVQNSVASSTCTLNYVNCFGENGQTNCTIDNEHHHDLVPHLTAKKSVQTTDNVDTLLRDCSSVLDIVDIAPEWSYTEGGTKLLVVGPWYSTTSQYSCTVDGIPVPTSCVQPGVLKCFTPAHNEGYVAVQVTCDGQIISNTIQLEYRSKSQTQDCRQWFHLAESELKKLLIDRLIFLEERLAQSHYRDGPVPSLKEAEHNLVSSNNLEGKLLWYIKMFTAGTWNDLDTFPVSNTYNMTLLHLAAALGYHRFIQAIIQWRCDNPSWFLDYEVDANCLDINSCTAIMWACVKGHEQAAITLFHWNSSTLKIRNKQGLSPLDLAQENGHVSLCDKLQHESSLDNGLISGDNYLSPPFPNIHDVPVSSGQTIQSDCALFKSPAPVDTQNRGMLGSLHIDIPQSASHTAYTGKEALLVRRQSDQALRIGVKSKRKLNKRFSVDLPSHTDENRSSRAGSCDRPIREANSEPHLSSTIDDALTRADNPLLSAHVHDPTSPDSMMMALQDSQRALLIHERLKEDQELIRMDTDEVSSNSCSPVIDVEKLSSDEESDQKAKSDRHSISTDGGEEAKQQMVTLAKQIIAAMPERIKYSPSRGDDFIIETTRERSSSYSSIASQPSPHASSYEEDSGISTPMGDSFAFEEYRYPDINTPASSLSPESTCLPSPYSPYNFALDSPPPTTAEFTEYFNAPATFMEKDFSQLTLSDQEQRRLYEAAKVIQKTFRLYRDKQQIQQQQQKEIYAAILIQKYYRRYKQYAYYKKMTQAAVLIQSQFRSYYAQKRFKKSRDAAVIIQNQYRTYKEHERLKKGGNKSVIIQQRYRSHYQRKNYKSQSSEGHVVQIVPESAESSPKDQSSLSGDSSSQAGDKAKLTTVESQNKVENTQ